MTELKITELYFSYGRKKVFQNFNITFGDGITLFLGANGSGKSTMFKLICGVLTPKKGKIEAFYNNEKISDPKSRIAYIPQTFNVFPSLKVREILTYICGERDKKLTPKQIKEQVDNAMELADITEYSDKKMRTLSGGTKQRVGIAQSVLGDPKIIIADEPTAGLDPEQRERYHRIVAGTAQNRSFIISTHLLDDTNYYSNLALISEGKLRFQGTKEEMIESVTGKIYRLTCSSGEFDEKNLPARLLSAKTENKMTCARIYSNEKPVIPYGEIQEVEGTLLDAWQNFCADNTDSAEQRNAKA